MEPAMPRDVQDVDWPALIARVHAGERARDVAREHGIDGRVLRMRALNADPEFAERHRERMRERMRALNADPEFAERHRERHRERMRERMRALHADPEFNPLASLSDAERADYDILKRNGYSRAEALGTIGRADLVTT